MNARAQWVKIGFSVFSLNDWFRLAAGLLAAGLLVPASRAETPTLSVWTADQQTCYTSSDIIDTNQWYAAERTIGIQASVESAPSGESITGLTFTCTIPSFLSPSAPDFDDDTPAYTEWNEEYSSLVCQIASPLSNGEDWSGSIDLISSNTWIRPLIYAKRTVYTTRLVPGQETNQTIVCDVFIPPGALDDMAVLTIRLNFWDIDTEGLDVSGLSGTSSSPLFIFDSDNNTFTCGEPSALSGSYSFTNHVNLTSYAAKDMCFLPGIQIFYSRIQTPWGLSSTIASRSLEHEYDNGLWIGASSPIAVLWDNQQMQDETYWNIGAQYVPADDNLPGLTDCFLFRTQSMGYDGRLSHQFFVDAEGTNLVTATFTTPDNTTFTMEVEPDEAEFEVDSLSEDSLARFTNGTYTIRLYDIDNALRQTYAVSLSGTSVTEIPQLLTPSAICSTDTQPYLSWNAASDSEVNATVLQIKNANIEDDDPMMWTLGEYNPLPTSYQVDQDLFASWTYDLMFAHAAQTTVNDMNVLSGYLSERQGFFNVATQSVAFVHVDTDEPRVFAGEDASLGLTSFGFLPGSNYTYTVDFGDGFTTNSDWGDHAYTAPGTYTVRVIVTDDTGASATGTVSMTVYALPALSDISRSSSGSLVTLTFPTIDGAFYSLLCTDNMTSPDWSTYVGALTGNGATLTLDDYQSSIVSQRFYRLECTLNPTNDVQMN